MNIVRVAACRRLTISTDHVKDANAAGGELVITQICVPAHDQYHAARGVQPPTQGAHTQFAEQYYHEACLSSRTGLE